MRWRESYERPESIRTSGESHGHMEIAVRYDLITPLGLREVAGVMGSPAFRANTEMWNNDSEGLVGWALCDVYAFLSGEGYFHLAKAAALILEALALEEGAERVMPGHVEGSLGFECLPPASMRAVARAAAELAGKIGPYTREHVGYPAHVLVGDAIGGMFAWLGVREESWDASVNLGRAALDLMDAIHAIKKWPELQAATMRGPGGSPPPIPEKSREDEVILGEWVFDGDMQVIWEPGKERTEEKAGMAEVTRMTLKWVPSKDKSGA